MATPKFEAHAVLQQQGREQHLSLYRDGVHLSYAAVLAQWRKDPAWRDFFITTLAQAPFAAFFWETPPLTVASAQRPFECVLVDSPELAAVPTDAYSFAEHFSITREVVTFANRGRDAQLIAPCPRAGLSAYPHIAAFSRHAPRTQQHALWNAVGDEVSARLGERPLWISTSGLGVYWLHIRLDSRPKYYSHSAYRDPAYRESD